MKVAYLFNEAEGSWYPHMVVEGLLSCPEVQASFNHSMTIFGQPLVHATPNFGAALETADFVIRNGEPHLQLREYDEPFERRNLWAKTILLDLRDESTPNEALKRKCLLYVSRRPMPNGGMQSGYGMVKAFEAVPSETRRLCHVAFLFNTEVIKKAYNCSMRARVWEELQVRPARQRVHFGRTPVRPRTDERRIDPRRYYREPPQGNPIMEYLHVLRHSMCVVTVPPDHGSGDGRTWEAFASGALVVTDQSINSGLTQPFVHGKHCLLFDARHPESIRETLDEMDALLRNTKRRLRIAKRGYYHARLYHNARQRVRAILKKAGGNVDASC